ncbi:hypothetical protein GHK56_10055 [Sinorhizobium meliloti]|nr:hypothetical protein [Sinorhizobium meliloti]
MGFGLLAFRLKRTNYLFGDTFGVADRYPFILTGGAFRLGGGSATVRQYLNARLVDEMHIAISPIRHDRPPPLSRGRARPRCRQ